MPYILVNIPEDGMIRTETEYRYLVNSMTKVVHRESVGLDQAEGIRVFSKLETIKSEWSGPESDEAILSLDGSGAAENIWMAESQLERLGERLKRWSSCYGGWKIRRLNT